MGYNLSDFCNNLRNLRRISKLTQEEMAALLNISINDLQQIEKGLVPQNITVDILFNTHNVFGIHTHLLLQSLFVDNG